MGSKMRIVGAVVGAVALCVALGACAQGASQAEPGEGAAAEAPEQQQAAFDAASMESWAQACPYQFASYEGGSGLAYTNPFKTGKVNAVDDVHNSNDESDGPFMTPCLACHSTEYALAVSTGDLSLYHLDEETAYATVSKEHSINCQSCHSDATGAFALGSQWVADAIAAGGVQASDKMLVCAQCHALASFDNIFTSDDPSTWSSLQAGIDPDDVYAWFLEQGQSAPAMVDHQLNNVLGGTHDTAGATCSTCHMQKLTADDGTVYTSHVWQTVRDNAGLFDNCAQCHNDSAADREAALDAYQAQFAERIAPVQEAIGQLSAAIAASTADEADLAQAQASLDKANFYLSYIADDVSAGFHSMGNEALIGTCIDTAGAAAAEGLASIAA